jgi:hypothetical protein
MTRRPRPSLVTTTLPALATLLGACQPGTPRFAPNPPPPHNDTPPIHDAAVTGVLEPTLVDLNNLPDIPMAGAPMPVTAMPPPPPPSPSPAPAPSAAAPSPSAAAPMAPAPMAPAPAAAAPAGVYLVHNHPPGTPCRPVSRTELLQVIQRGGR